MDQLARTVQINVQTPTRLCSLEIFDTFASMAIARSIIEGKTYPVVDFVKDVKVVVDIGANVGAASFFFAIQYPAARIFSFEPCPEIYQLLSRNMASFPNVHPFDFGLFDHDCQVPLYLGKDDGVTNSVGFSSLNGERFVEVVLHDARNFFRNQHIDAIDILKVDTEGCELPILQSMADLLDKIKVIYLEYHDEADRLAIDVLLRRTHILASAKLLHPHRGELCYIAYQTFPSLAALDQLRIRREPASVPVIPTENQG